MDIIAYALSKKHTNKKIDETVLLLSDLPEKVEALDQVTEDAKSVLANYPILLEDGEAEEHYVLENTDIDTTLSVAGKAADAKVVGDQIAAICAALRKLGVNI